jgi:hypothetical protein
LYILCDKTKAAVIVPVFRGFFYTAGAFFNVSGNRDNRLNDKTQLAAAFRICGTGAAARRQVPLWRYTPDIPYPFNMFCRFGRIFDDIFTKINEFFVQRIYGKLVSCNYRHGRRYFDTTFTKR